MSGDLLELVQLPFVQRMFVAGLLVSLACGIIGTYVVVRRIVFISGGISHTTFGGIGLAYFLQDKLAWTWFEPSFGATIVALGAAVVLGSPWIRARIREDSAIGVVWVVGMAAGILLLNLVDRSRVLVLDPVSILFGNILLIEARELMMMGGLVLLLVVVVALLFKDLHILTFDEELAHMSGIPVAALNNLLLVMVALTIVVLIKVVGVVLVIAMLTIPAAMAGLFTRSLRTMMALATVLAVLATFSGSLLSLYFDLPPGAAIVLLLSGMFGLALGLRTAIARFGNGGS